MAGVAWVAKAVPSGAAAARACSGSTASTEAPLEGVVEASCHCQTAHHVVHFPLVLWQQQQMPQDLLAVSLSRPMHGGLRGSRLPIDGVPRPHDMARDRLAEVAQPEGRQIGLASE